jgi:hypothetical protein
MNGRRPTKAVAVLTNTDAGFQGMIAKLPLPMLREWELPTRSGIGANILQQARR